MKKLLTLTGCALLLCGCANLNKTAFNAENLAADTGIGAVSSFNAYYNANTNKATLTEAKNTVYDASKKLSVSLATTEKIRQDYATNSATSNKTALTISLEVLSENTSNIVSVVKFFQK